MKLSNNEKARLKFKYGEWAIITGALSNTHYYSQQFIKQKRGGIILMSSMVASQGKPYFAKLCIYKPIYKH